MDNKSKDSSKIESAKQIEMQILAQHVQQLQQQLQEVEAQLVDLVAAIRGIDDLEKSSLGAEVLSPLCAGIYVKTSLDENKKLLVNVGSGTVVEKSTEEIRKILDTQFKEVQKNHDIMAKELEKMIEYIQNLERKA